MSKRANQNYSPAVRGFTKVALPVPIRSAMKRDWHGHEHIPREGGVIVAGNHLSYADWAAMALFIHEAGRYPAFLIKSSAFNVKVLGPFLHGCGQLPVNRGSTDAALVLKDAEKALAQGECVIIYPEGTATRDPAKWPMVAKTGVARMALAAGYPVIPVATWGAQEILPYGSKKVHLRPRHTVQMLAGPPVDLSAYAGQPLTRDVLRAATAAIMADITGLLAQLRGEPAPASPYDPAAARRAARMQARAESLQSEPDGDSPQDASAPEPPQEEAGEAAAPGGEPASGTPGGDEPRKAMPA